MTTKHTKDLEVLYKTEHKGLTAVWSSLDKYLSIYDGKPLEKNCIHRVYLPKNLYRQLDKVKFLDKEKEQLKLLEPLKAKL